MDALQKFLSGSVGNETVKNCQPGISSDSPFKTIAVPQALIQVGKSAIGSDVKNTAIFRIRT
jgi:hypothetical protein